jgi:hypothetical protein
MISFPSAHDPSQGRSATTSCTNSAAGFRSVRAGNTVRGDYVTYGVFAEYVFHSAVIGHEYATSCEHWVVNDVSKLFHVRCGRTLIFWSRIAAARLAYSGRTRRTFFAIGTGFRLSANHYRKDRLRLCEQEPLAILAVRAAPSEAGQERLVGIEILRTLKGLNTEVNGRVWIDGDIVRGKHAKAVGLRELLRRHFGENTTTVAPHA